VEPRPLALQYKDAWTFINLFAESGWGCAGEKNTLPRSIENAQCS